MSEIESPMDYSVRLKPRVRALQELAAVSIATTCSSVLIASIASLAARVSRSCSSTVWGAAPWIQLHGCTGQGTLRSPGNPVHHRDEKVRMNAGRFLS